MGGGLESQHLLCVLPFPEPTGVVDRLKRQHPGLRISYVHPDTDNILSHEQGITDDAWKTVTILATLSALPATPDKAPDLARPVKSYSSVIGATEPVAQDCSIGLLTTTTSWITYIFWSAGTNHVMNHPIYTDTKIPLTTASGIHGPNISEWVLMTMLNSSHHYSTMYEWQKDQRWGKPTANDSVLRTIRDSVGMRLGVLGYGSIGRQVARVCKAMGMDVIAFTAHERKTAESKRDHGFIVPGTGDADGSIPSAWYSGFEKEKLHQFLGDNIDVLLVSVPLTKETHHLLGKEEFDILAKKNAFVSNISRGQIIDQDALIAQLRAFDADKDGLVGGGRRGLRGAALDVTDPEPLPDGHPLWSTPNCIVTPHISGLGAAYVYRAFQVLELNLERKEQGGKLVNLVNREEGY